MVNTAEEAVSTDTLLRALYLGYCEDARDFNFMNMMKSMKRQSKLVRKRKVAQI